MLVDPGGPYRDDAVRDGRHLMENDWHKHLDALAGEILAFGRWAESALPAIYVLEHPNYRYQVTGDETV